MKKIMAFLFSFACFMMLFWTNALAYVDPSAMTYVIQAVAAVVIVSGTALTFNVKRIKRFFKNRKEGKNPVEAVQVNEQDGESFAGEFKEDDETK